MKKGYTFLALAALFMTSFSVPLTAQTQLGASDLLFTLMNLEGNNDDAFGFVLLTDVEAGTVVHITDKEYETGVGFEEFEGILTITFDLAFGCGSEIIFTDQNPEPPEFVFGANLPGISVTPDTDNAFQLATSGETLIAFRGDNLSNPCNDCFITALANTGVGFGVDATGSGDLPPGLTEGINAMAMSAQADGDEWDNIKYNCSTTQADPGILRTELTTVANWTFDDEAPLPAIPCEPAFACGAPCIPSVIDGITIVAGSNGPDGLVTLMVDGQLNGGGQWEWANPGADCETAPTFLTGPSVQINFVSLDATFYLRATGGCLTEVVCFPYVPSILLGVPSFEAPTQEGFCKNSGLIEGLSGGMPIGGIYSGEGVIDNGDGLTFKFDPALASTATVSVTYTLGNECNSSATAEIEIVEAPIISFILSVDAISVEAGLQTGLGGATPEGGIYSGSGVTDDGNGMTFTFDPAIAGIGQTEVIYTFTDATTDCSNSSASSLTVIVASVMGNECTDATDLNPLFGQGVGNAQTSALFNNDNATNEASDPEFGFECFGEPDGGGAMPSLENTLWFTFTGDGETYLITTVQCNATDYIDFGDTQIAIYTGNCSNLTGVACNEDAPDVDPNGPYPSEVTFPTENGVVYQMLIDGFAGSDGEFCVQVTQAIDVAVKNILESDSKVYPNPTNGQINISSLQPERVTVFDHVGRQVMDVEKAGNVLDLNGLPAGLYLLKMFAGKEVYSAKVVKE